jgi:hypothetical protein
MAFNGSGVFVRLYNWVNDRDADVAITSTRMDAEDDGFATGLSNCVTADGQTTTTAVVPFAAGISLYDGLVGTPAVRFTSDTNTGMWRIGADNIGFSCQGVTVFELDGDAASAATGLKVTSAAAAAGADLSVISSGTNENLTINAKGSGTISLNPTGTGAIYTSRNILLTSDGAGALGSTSAGFANLFLAATGKVSWGNDLAYINYTSGGDYISFNGATVYEFNDGYVNVNGYVRADRLIVDGSTVPTNGMYLPNSNTVGFAADSTQALTVTPSSVNIISKLNFGTATELTIASGVVTITRSYHTIDTEADAATDDLDTINGGVEGDLLILRAADDARSVVIKNGTGNIRGAGAVDRTLTHSQDTAQYMFIGSTWVEINFRDATA